MTNTTIMLVQDRKELKPGDRVLLRYPSGIQYIETVDDLTESGDVIWTISHYFHERKMVLSTDPVELWIYPKDFRPSLAQSLSRPVPESFSLPVQRLGESSQAFLPFVSGEVSKYQPPGR